MKMEFQELNTNKFHDELIASGISPDEIVVTSGSDKTWVEFTNAALEDVIKHLAEIHSPTPRHPDPTEVDYLVDLDYRLSLIELGL